MEYCGIQIPYAFDYGVMMAVIEAENAVNPEEDDRVYSYSRYFGLNTANESYNTLSRWTVAAVTSAVPEPQAYAMFVIGLGLLGFVGRRKQA